jgi:hypothetical protein
MLRFSCTLILVSLLLLNCGTPVDPESIDGDDGGYKIVSKFSTPGHTQDVLIDNTFAYVAHGEGGVMIINVANPNKPNAISSVNNDDIKGYAYKIARNDSVLYIAAGGFGITVINVADPQNPNVPITNINPKPAKNVHVMGNFLFVAASEQGVRLAEIGSNANYPDPRGDAATPGFAQSICSSPDSNYLLVACGEMGLATIDISELVTGYGTYLMAGWIDLPEYSEDVVIHPTLPYAYVACGTAGLTIVDYSDPENMKILGRYDSDGYAKEILYKEGRVYMTTEARGLKIFDVTNVTSPVLIGTVKTQYAKGLDMDDNYIYVADEVEGLITIKIP